MITRRILAAVAAAGIVAGAAQSAHADAPAATPNIIGGSTATAVGYMVQVYDVRPAAGDVFQCGGTLVARSWVLTAQHCLADPGETTAVRIGSTQLGGGTRIAVDRSEVPPTVGDLALLHLVTPAAAPLVRLASRVPALPATGTIYGWGAETATAPGELPVLSPVLKQASQYVWSTDNPDSLGGPGVSSWGLGDTGAGYQGDSGGPLVIGGLQVGVISDIIGAPTANAFNDHANVAAHRSWIRSITGR